MSGETKYDWISALVDGQLAGQELQDARRKLADDAEAQKLFEQLQSMRDDLQSLPPLKLGADFADRVMQQIAIAANAHANPLQPALKPKAPDWRITIGVLSTLAAMLVVGLLIFVNQSKEKGNVAQEHTKTGIDAVTDDNADAFGQNVPGDFQSADQGVFAREPVSGKSGVAPTAAEPAAEATVVAGGLGGGATATEEIDDGLGARRKEQDHKDEPSNRSNERKQILASSGVRALDADAPSSASLGKRAETMNPILAFVRFNDHSTIEQVERMLQSSGVEIVDAAVADKAELTKELRQRAMPEGDLRDGFLDFESADVLIIEASQTQAKLVLNRLAENTDLQFGSNAPEAFGAERFTKDNASRRFFAARAETQLSQAAGAGGESKATPLSDGRTPEKTVNPSDKTQKLASLQPQISRDAEKADIAPDDSNEIRRSDTKQSPQENAAAPGATIGNGELPVQLTARYLKNGTPEFERLQREAAVVRDEVALTEGWKDSALKELKKKAGASDTRNKLTDQAKIKSDRDSGSLAESLQELGEKSRIANEHGEMTQMVRIYILVNPNHEAKAAKSEAAKAAKSEAAQDALDRND